MTVMFSQQDAVERIESANLKAGSWGGTEAVCMMSALVSGAKSVDDCATAGWPEWLASLNVSLFDANVGADDEGAARIEFALGVAKAIQKPRDAHKAKVLFLIYTLERVERYDTAGVVRRVVELLKRKLNGEDVAEDLKSARVAADADAAYAAADAADAAAYAARAAADAAAYADAADAAAYAAAADADAAYAAADAADAAAYAARAAADAAYAAADAARADLIKALENS